MKKFYLVLIIIIFLNFQLEAQNNIHYSQYYNSPLLLNPALAGQFPDDLIRLTALSRQQWEGLGDGGDYLYKTMSLSADISLFKRRLGLGLQLINDDAGGVYNTINVYPTLSYSFIMGDDALTFGMQYMYSLYQLDRSKLNAQQPEEFFPSETNSDFNFGINFHKDFVFAKFDVGGSAQHLLQPEQRFAKNGEPARAKMYYRTYITSDIDLTERFKILPGYYGSFQSQATNFIVGTNVSYRVLGSSEEGSRFIVGLWFRTNYNNLESIIPKMGFQSGKLKVLASYDYNSGMALSNSQYFNGLLNTFEISVIFTAKPKKVPPLLEDRFILNPRY